VGKNGDDHAGYQEVEDDPPVDVRHQDSQSAQPKDDAAQENV